jgi:hypothetical protein
MMYPDWFPEGTTRSTSNLPFNYEKDLSAVSQAEARALGERMPAELPLRGRLSRVKKEKNGSWFFRFDRPGTIEEVRLTPNQELAEITVRRGKFAWMMNRLHHLLGFEGGSRYFVWGILIDLVSISLILFSFSGVYLWYRTKRNRLFGWFILGGSTAYVLGSVIFLLLRD